MSPKMLKDIQLLRAIHVFSRTCNVQHLKNSLHYPAHAKPESQAINPLALELTLPGSPISPQPIPVDVGPLLHARLSVHNLLHTLIRTGDSGKVGQYTGRSMIQGIRIRGATLEAVVRSLCRNDKPDNLPLIMANDAAAAFDIHPNHFAHPYHYTAYKMLMYARNSGQYRSARMYDILIGACVKQGRFLASSLLFSVLVKDWQTYSARQKSISAQDTSVSSKCMKACSIDIGVDNPSSQGKLSREEASLLAGAGTETLTSPPYPTVQLLTLITTGIETVMSQDPKVPHDVSYLSEPLQSLANLTLLVEEGHIHYGKLSQLIRASYRVPRTEHAIWSRRGGRPVHINAYRYFHGFMMKLIRSFKGAENLPIPSLDTRSHNALLHYALRHRFSPRLASDILEHMCGSSGRPLKPTLKTFNILTRSGTILGRLDISEAALEAPRRERNFLTSNNGSFLPSADKEAGLHLTARNRPELKPGLRKSPIVLHGQRNAELTLPKGML